ncbi:MAG: Lrp/AsnC family transcriptional regulator [Syntrophomonadaceae bacterium]|nr:Lrp/AsnC family transcriptional regulator [Syntrophomonadaceae bacterium]
MNERDKTIIKYLQGDLSLSSEPFRLLADQLGCTQDEVMEAVEELQDRGIMRRIGAILRHRRAGYVHNAMIMWVVPGERVDEAGEYMASFTEISHCYLRETPAGWPYNLYSMIHARTSQRLEEIVESIARELGIQEYKVVRTVKEFKKTSMKYY